MNENLLKRALCANAIFSTLSGGGFLFFASTLAEFMGVGGSLLYQLLGVGLLGFAAYVGWIGTRTPLNPAAALQISLADGVWVVGTGVVIGLAFRHLTLPGIVTLLGVAAIVLLFAYLQLRGITAVYRHPEKLGMQRVCVSVATQEPADRLWPLIADMARIGEFSPNLAQVIIREGAAVGPDAVRQCTDQKGNTWAEQCTRLDDQTRRLEVTFLADEPGFPYPFKRMEGGWEVVARDKGSTVNIWFDVTPKQRLLQPIILALMGKTLGRDFGNIVARMAAAARGNPIAPTVAPSWEGISARLVVC